MRPAAWLVLGAVVITAAGLRVLGLDHPLWIDEAGSLAQASAPDFWANARHDVHPPLFFALLRLGLKATSSFVMLRLPSVVCGLALVLLAIWALRRSLVAAAVAGLVAAALPELLLHSQQLRPYALLYFTLAVALWFAVRIFRGARDLGTQVGLAVGLVIAAATHLVTVFFLLALVPLLAWPEQGRNLRSRILALLPLVPAGLLLLWFKFSFVDQPSELAEGWWMPRTTPSIALASLAEMVAWSEIRWLADAASRHLPAGSPLVLGIAVGGPIFAGVTAWARPLEPLVAALLAAGLTYLAAAMTYSFCFEPLVSGRTLLPALLPLTAALALGLAAQPRGWQRTAAAAAIAVYLVFTTVPILRRVGIPFEGLRGLAAQTRENYRHGDALILFRSVDFGLRPYWPDIASTEPVSFNPAQPTAPQLAALRTRLDRLAPGARVLLVYRDDYYFQKNHGMFEAVLGELAAGGRQASEIWHERDLALLLASRSSPK